MSRDYGLRQAGRSQAMGPGTRLAHYEILGPLGAGGMGEVWRARDTRLQRDVALKFLPQHFTNDASRLARFEGEAVVLASLNHPNIAAIYGLEQAGGAPFLVLELVEGQTLYDRLMAGPILVREALGIATQIAHALEAAHEKGVIHRDLKPANVKLTPEGKVKVLDFGLAKAYGEAASAPTTGGELTLPKQETELGLVVGTPAYMSPEQAAGKTADKRSDIWAFGVVLYEMLTGRRLFEGKSTSHVLVHVMEQEPDWSALPPLPAGVLPILQRCLQKDRNERLRDIGDVRIHLQDSQTHPIRVADAAPRAGERRRWLWPAVGAVAVAAAAVSLVALLRQASQPVAPPPAALQFEIARPDVFASTPWITISPDGRQLLYGATSQGEPGRLWVRSLETQTARPLDATVSFNGRPFWSADSRFIVFSQPDGRLRRIDAAGGPAQVIADVPAAVVGGYSSNDTMRYAVANRGLHDVPATGGTPRPVSLGGASDSVGAFMPSPMPAGNFVFCRCTAAEQRGIFVGTADGAPPRQILPDLSFAQYAPSPDPDLGYVLFSRGAANITGAGGTLMAQAIDPRRLEPIGSPVAIAERVNGFSASDTGILVYSTDSGGTPIGVPGILVGQLTWFDREGRVLGTVGDPSILRIPRISPDGKLVALEQGDRETQNMDVYVLEFERGVNNRFTFGPGREVSPVWSADGSSIVYTNMPGDGTTEWYRRSADLAGAPELLFRLPVSGVPSTLSPDGRFAIYTELVAPGSLKAVDLSRVAEARESVELVVSGFQTVNAMFSPDGRWFAYVSAETGSPEVYVRGFDADAAAGEPLTSGGKLMVSKGGAKPGGAVWRRDGRELFYLAPDGSLMSVEVDVEPTFRPTGPPRALFKVAQEVNYFDVAPDGEQFLISVPVGSGVSSPPYKVVLNWTTTLD
jgi:Tol biopolymer transport system component